MKLSKEQVKQVKCKACGGLVLLFVKDAPPYYKKGYVGHSKVNGVVTCALYNRLSSEQFFQRHLDAEPAKRVAELFVDVDEN